MENLVLKNEGEIVAFKENNFIEINQFVFYASSLWIKKNLSPIQLSLKTEDLNFIIRDRDIKEDAEFGIKANLFVSSVVLDCFKSATIKDMEDFLAKFDEISYIEALNLVDNSISQYLEFKEVITRSVEKMQELEQEKGKILTLSPNKIITE